MFGITVSDLGWADFSPRFGKIDEASPTLSV